MTTAYVGTKTTRGYANRELNVSPPGGGEAGRRFFAEFGRTAATAEWGGITKSNYHALQIALDRPFKGGLFLKGQYTFSKALNMTDEDGWVDVLFNSEDQFHRNYARAGFDRPHNFSIGYVYALPFGQDARGSMLSAFQNLTQQARYGNMGRNALRGPAYWTYNMSLFRSFPLGGRTRLQFRVEGFALGNNPRWRNPATDQRNVGNANFLRLTEINDTGTRNVRLGVRLSF